MSFQGNVGFILYKNIWKAETKLIEICQIFKKKILTGYQLIYQCKHFLHFLQFSVRTNFNTLFFVLFWLPFTFIFADETINFHKRIFCHPQHKSGHFHYNSPLHLRRLIVMDRFSHLFWVWADPFLLNKNYIIIFVIRLIIDGKNWHV